MENITIKICKNMGTGLHILLFSYVLTLLGMTLVYVYILDILLCMDVFVSILIKKYCTEVAIFFFFLAAP